MYHIFIDSSVGGHLGGFHVLAIVNSAAVNIVLHVSFRIIVLSGYMLRSGIAGPYGNSIFSFLRRWHVFLSPQGCISSTSLMRKRLYDRSSPWENQMHVFPVWTVRTHLTVWSII